MRDHLEVVNHQEAMDIQPLVRGSMLHIIVECRVDRIRLSAYYYSS